MALTIRDVDPDFISDLQRLTMAKTASKALVRSGEMALELDVALAAAREENRKLKEDLRRVRQILDGLKPLCLQVLDVVAQRDLFDG